MALRDSLSTNEELHEDACLEAAHSVSKDWSSGVSDDLSAAGLCDRLVVCERGVTDGTCTWRVQEARSGGALACAMGVL